MSAALRRLIETADEGEWHSSEDCRIEGRYNDCELCKAIRAAKAETATTDSLSHAIAHARGWQQALAQAIATAELLLVLDGDNVIK